MQRSTEVPTPSSLADLVARCDQINRFKTELTAGEETRVAALASGLLVMRQVLRLAPLEPDTLPARQRRIQHWALTGGHVKEAETPKIRAVHGTLALDEHEQVKILSNRNWRRQWQAVSLWRDGEGGLSAADMMAFLARLANLAQQRAPDAARALLKRGEAVAAAEAMQSARPRERRA